MKLTVSEYAKRLNVSVQTIYKKIKRGVIPTVIENGITYVIADSSEFTEEIKQDDNNYCKELLKVIKTQQKEIKRLTKKNEDVFKSFLGEYQKALSPPKKETKDDVVDVKIKSKKNKNKKGKKK